MRLVLARAITALFWFVTAGYCLLSAVPFASEQFLKPGLVPALVTFASWHPWISLAALAVCATALAPWLRSGHGGARGFVAAWAMVAVASFFAPALAQLEPSTNTFALALLSLIPPAWIAVMDLPRPRSRAPEGAEHRQAVGADFASCMIAAFAVTLMHALSAVPPFPRGVATDGTGILRSLLLHGVLFSGIFAAISVVRGVSQLISPRGVVEAWLARGAVAVALVRFLSYMSCSDPSH